MFKKIKLLNILLFFISFEFIGGIAISMLSFQYTGITEEAITCMKALQQSELRVYQWKIENNLARVNDTKKECEWILNQSKMYDFDVYLNQSGKLFIQKAYLSLNLQDTIYIFHVLAVIMSLIYGILCVYFYTNISNSIIIFIGIIWSIVGTLLSLKLNLFVGTLGIFILLMIIIFIEYILLILQKKNITHTDS